MRTWRICFDASCAAPEDAPEPAAARLIGDIGAVRVAPRSMLVLQAAA